MAASHLTSSSHFEKLCVNVRVGASLRFAGPSVGKRGTADASAKALLDELS